MSALVWTATEEDIVLVVPASVLSEVRAGTDETSAAVLAVLLGLPVAIVDVLDAHRAKDAGDLAALVGAIDLPSAHAAACALARGWPLVTAEPAQYTAVRELIIEELP